MKYVKLIKDITHNEDGILILIKKGTLLEQVSLPSSKCGYRVFNPDKEYLSTIIPAVIVIENPSYFVEVPEHVWNQQTGYSKIIDLILKEDPYINWESFIEELQRRFSSIKSDKIADWVKKLADQPTTVPYVPSFPTYPTFPNTIDTTRCPSCGNLKGSPCWSTACPYRVQVWYSTSTSEKTE